MLQAGILAGYATDWLGANNVRRYAVQFREQVWPGDTVVCSGTVTRRYEDAGERKVDVELLCTASSPAAPRSRARRPSSSRDRGGDPMSRGAAADRFGADRDPTADAGRPPGARARVGRGAGAGARVRLLSHRPARRRRRPRAAAPAVVPGHQVVGMVDALGDEVATLAVGDRVGVRWLHHTDGVCEFCRRGEENLCVAADFTGWTVDGGYADHVTVPEDFAVRLPPGLDDLEAAPLLCAGVIGYRASAARRGAAR